MRADEDALVCDFAETYGVFDWRGLPLRLAATLAAGLREDSRCMMRLNGCKAAPDTLLRAGILDALRVLIWQNTRDGAEGVNCPTPVLGALLGEEETEQTVGFASADEFDAWRQRMLTK